MTAETLQKKTSIPLESGYISALMQNLLYVGIFYAVFYFSRYNMSAAMPQVRELFGWTKGQMGFFDTALPIIYGLSVIINGPLTDRIGGKKAFLWGAAGVVLANIIMGICTLVVAQPAVLGNVGKITQAVVVTPAVFHYLSSGWMLVIMIAIWIFNGYCQSFGAIAIVKINYNWVPQERRGLFSGVFGVLIRLGLIFAFVGIPLIAANMPVRFVFWIPALCVACMGFFVWLLVKDTPAERGFAPLPHTKAYEQPGSLRQILREFMQKLKESKTLWMLFIGSAMIGFVRRGTIDTWFRQYFSEMYHGEDTAYNLCAWGIAILGIIGGFAMGIMSDKYFKKMRSPVIFIGFIGMAIMLPIAGLSDRLNLGPFAAAILLAVLSFFVNGAHGLMGGAVTMDIGKGKHTGTMTGMIDGAQYVLASWFTGAVLGMILDKWGWTPWHWILIPFPIFGAILMWLRWGPENDERIKREEEERQKILSEASAR